MNSIIALCLGLITGACLAYVILSLLVIDQEDRHDHK